MFNKLLFFLDKFLSIWQTAEGIAGKIGLWTGSDGVYPGESSICLKTPTHIAFGPNNREIITDLKNNRFVFREGPEEPLQVSPVPMRGPHSVVYNPKDKLYYANDTENHRMIAFSDLSKPTIQAQTKKIAGINLHRPHDVVLDPSTGWIYVINPGSGHVFRFTAIGENESAIKVPLQELSLLPMENFMQSDQPRAGLLKSWIGTLPLSKFTIVMIQADEMVLPGFGPRPGWFLMMRSFSKASGMPPVIL